MKPPASTGVVVVDRGDLREGKRTGKTPPAAHTAGSPRCTTEVVTAGDRHRPEARGPGTADPRASAKFIAQEPEVPPPRDPLVGVGGSGTTGRTTAPTPSTRETSMS